VGKHEAEVMLDHATAHYDKDLTSLPKFCSAYYSCTDPDDWGVSSTEMKTQ
jgi:hypothetical protein